MLQERLYLTIQQERHADLMIIMALTQLCAKSKEAWRTWQDNGRLLSGPLYDTKNEARKLVKQRIKSCAAMKERKLIQTREKHFRSSAPYRFKIPQKRRKSQCTRLRVDGNLISDPLQLMKAWTQHFRNLTQSQIGSNPASLKLQRFCHPSCHLAFRKRKCFWMFHFLKKRLSMLSAS